MYVPRGRLAVLNEICRDGATNRVIARRLFITENTVKTHIRRLLDSTGCADRTALAVAVLRGDIRVVTQRVKGDEAA